MLDFEQGYKEADIKHLARVLEWIMNGRAMDKKKVVDARWRENTRVVKEPAQDSRDKKIKLSQVRREEGRRKSRSILCHGPWTN
jgi:hypothetical protein